METNNIEVSNSNTSAAERLHKKFNVSYVDAKSVIGLVDNLNKTYNMSKIIKAEQVLELARLSGMSVSTYVEALRNLTELEDNDLNKAEVELTHKIIAVVADESLDGNEKRLRIEALQRERAAVNKRADNKEGRNTFLKGLGIAGLTTVVVTALNGYFKQQELKNTTSRERIAKYKADLKYKKK